MTIERVAGRTLREALEKARKRVGERAVVLTHKTSGNGVVLAVSREVPHGRQALGQLRAEAERLIADKGAGGVGSAGTLDLERRLRACGASSQFTDRVCEAVAGRLNEGKHPLDLASEELEAMLTVAQSRHAPGATSYLALIGAAGVGKTTTLGKLAARLVGIGKRVVLVTLDVHRLGAVEQLRALGKELGCPAIALEDARQLARPWKRRSQPDVVLIDTSGRPAQDARALAQLNLDLAARDPELFVEAYLVAPVVSRPAVIQETLDAIGELPLAGAVVTKVDETQRPVPVLEFLLRRGLPLAFVSDGRGLDGGLHRAGGQVFADLLLQGKVR